MQRYSALEAENDKNRRLLQETDVSEQSNAARQEELTRLRTENHACIDRVRCASLGSSVIACSLTQIAQLELELSTMKSNAATVKEAHDRMSSEFNAMKQHLDKTRQEHEKVAHITRSIKSTVNLCSDIFGER